MAEATCEMPSAPFAEIDHLLTYVHDIDKAAETFARLGFTLTPPSRIDGMGITNRLALLEPSTEGAANFVEMMMPHDRARLPAPMAQTLSGEERIKSVVLMTRDAHLAQTAMTASGLEVASPIRVKRAWTLSAHETVHPEFDIIYPAFDAPLAFNACRYLDVQLYLRREWMAHANGARRLTAVYAVAEDAATCAKFYARLFGRAAVRRERDSWRGEAFALSPGRTALVIMSPDVARARFGSSVEGVATGYIGYRVEVRDLGLTLRLLCENRVAHDASAERIIVTGEAACGNIIEFAQSVEVAG